MVPERSYAVYILASKPWGTLYTGVTADLQARVYQHKSEFFEGFTKKYGVKTLVHFELHGTAAAAIHREKTHQEVATRVEDQSNSDRQPRLERSCSGLVPGKNDIGRNRKLGRPHKAGDDARRGK